MLFTYSYFCADPFSIKIKKSKFQGIIFDFKKIKLHINAGNLFCDIDFVTYYNLGVFAFVNRIWDKVFLIYL